jgi:hypothetical protein
MWTALSSVSLLENDRHPLLYNSSPFLDAEMCLSCPYHCTSRAAGQEVSRRQFHGFQVSSQASPRRFLW